METTEKPQKTFFISLRVRLLVGFTLIFSIAFALAFYWFYTFTQDQAWKHIKEDLSSTMRIAAGGINVPNFVALAKEGKPRADGYSDDPRYWEHVTWLANVNKAEPRALLYTYVKGKEENQILYIGSNGALMNPPQGVKFLESKISKGSSLKGLSETTYKLTPYQDQYGSWISGYMPVTNEKGEIVGAIGVDFRADYVYEVQQGLMKNLIIAFLIGFIILFLLVYFISNSLASPLSALSRIAEKIGEGDYQQDLSRYAKRKLSDEIGTLAQVFAIMVSKVYQREKSLKQQVEQLKIEIDETKRLRQVREIVDSDFFKGLQARAGEMRDRRQRRNSGEEPPPADKPAPETPLDGTPAS